jgi:hypothetical protein
VGSEAGGGRAAIGWRERRAVGTKMATEEGRGGDGRGRDGSRAREGIGSDSGACERDGQR